MKLILDNLWSYLIHMIILYCYNYHQNSEEKAGHHLFLNLEYHLFQNYLLLNERFCYYNNLLLN